MSTGNRADLNADTPRPPAAGPPRRAIFRQAVLYPNMYAWYLLLASLDIMLTWVILHLGGHELNSLANWIIHRYDLPGIVTYKFVLLLFVVGVCEVVGRHSARTGLMLARWAVVITAFPVLVGLIHLLNAWIGYLT